ncbi:MAG TPA: GNAT family N-acetyltransferase [Candidatus Binatia bacterium]|nr:GNAT family N-acetyltransferase [Candidatus Binatia bacterium]
MAETLALRIVRKIAEIPGERWDCLGRGCSPFVRWDWLDAFEQTGCVTEETGWLPHHLVVEREQTIIAACPMYLKLHSMGEFVFDWEWADAARHAGIQYYPKILVGVPFTPATGQRFLTAPGEDRRQLVQFMGQALRKIATDNKISSVHVNFCLSDEREALEAVGFVSRSGIQYHWQNRGYTSFDDYLGSFRSERRNKVKRERREVAERGIAIRAVEGTELTPNHMQTMFRLYKDHVDRLYYGRQYLTQEFFMEIQRRFAANTCLMLAQRDGKVIAGTFNIRDDTAMYGRYWGAFEDVPFLHFNVCYYSAIEHSIKLGLKRFEAGAGGSFKQLRGLDPEHTTSVHFIVNGKFRHAVERFLTQEREMIRQKREMLLEHTQLKSGSSST